MHPTPSGGVLPERVGVSLHYQAGSFAQGSYAFSSLTSTQSSTSLSTQVSLQSGVSVHSLYLAPTQVRSASGLFTYSVTQSSTANVTSSVSTFTNLSTLTLDQTDRRKGCRSARRCGWMGHMSIRRRW